MIRVQISEEALRDLNEGFLFYERQEPGLGDYFVTCLRSDIERLKFAAGTHRIVHEDYQHVVSKIFPYGVFYTLDSKADLAIVWAVIDLRRDPRWIRDHLERQP